MKNKKVCFFITYLAQPKEKIKNFEKKVLIKKVLGYRVYIIEVFFIGFFIGFFIQIFSQGRFRKKIEKPTLGDQGKNLKKKI